MPPRRPKNLDALFTALAEPTRRAVLERLTHGEATVTELAEPFAMSLQAFLKHVRVLEEAGLVRRTRIGRTNHLSLVPDAVHLAASWLNERIPASLPAVSLQVPDARRAELLARARALQAGLGARMALLRRALDGPPPDTAVFDPDAATVRALRVATQRRPALEEALRLFDALGELLAREIEDEQLDTLRELVLPLGLLVHELKPFWPAVPVKVAS